MTTAKQPAFHLADASRVSGTRCGRDVADTNLISNLVAFVKDNAAGLKNCGNCENGRQKDNAKIKSDLIRYANIPADCIHHCLQCDKPVGVSSYEQERGAPRYLLCNNCLEVSEGEEYSWNSDAARK